MGAAENDRKHGDLDVGAMGSKTLWPTKKTSRKHGWKDPTIHMQEECKGMI